MDFRGASLGRELHQQQRQHLLSVPSSPESRESIFTSSLPSSLLGSSMTQRGLLSRAVSIGFSEDTVEEENVDEDRRMFIRSLSGGVPSSLSKQQRPRSASLHTNQLTPPSSGGFKRTLRTMSGRRPSSARNRAGSMGVDQETKAITNKVETTFATVRKKLTELSAEDTLLQERMHRLSSEILAMQRYITGLNSAKQTSKKSRTLPIVSGKNSLAPPLLTSWGEDTDGMKNPDDDSAFRPHHLSLLANNHTHYSDGNDSVGSCSGSLADSEGSTSSPGASQTLCSIIVVNHDDELSPVVSTSASTRTRFLKSLSGYEDDVFLS